MTARGDDDIRSNLAECLKQGCDAYVSKVREHVAKGSAGADEAGAWRRVGLEFSLERLKDAATQDWREALLKCIAIIMTREMDSVDKALEASDLHLILDNLRLDFTSIVRAQATLVAVTCLKIQGQPAEAYLKSYIVSRVEGQRQDGLIEAFSAAAALFPALPATGAALFLADGFAADLRSRAEASKSATLRRAALELLSAACADGECRAAVAKQCTGWLERVKNTSGGDDADKLDSALAAVILTKIQYKDASEANDLVSKFRDMLVSSDDDLLSLSVEGLAYRSTDPKAKQRLCEDPEFLKVLISKIKQSASAATPDAAAVFGGLTVLSNLTVHQPKQSAEQRRMAQLKAYANRTASPSSATANPLESDASVDKRCVAVIAAGIVSLLVAVAAKATLSLANAVAAILDSISVPQQTRGTLAQQGAFDLALRLSAISFSSSSPSSTTTASQQSASAAATTETVLQIAHRASMALARMLVKLDPHLLFPPSRPRSPSAAIAPLCALLRTQSDPEQRDLWPVLESLMALTNLATLSPPSEDAAVMVVADEIAQQCWDDVEAAMLSPALPVRRAAVQCVCNLSCMSEVAVGKFVDLDLLPDPTRNPDGTSADGGGGGGGAKQQVGVADDGSKKQRRVALLVAFTHPDEDRGVLLSASAALASLLAFDVDVDDIGEGNKGASRGGTVTVAERFLKADGGVEKAVELVKSSDADLKARGVAMFEALLLKRRSGGTGGAVSAAAEEEKVKGEVRKRVKATAGGTKALMEAGGEEMESALSEG